MSLLPRSLTGRLALVMALALLVAQGVSFALLVRAEERAATLRAVTGATLPILVTLEAEEADPRPFARRRGRFAARRVRVTDEPEAAADRLATAERVLASELADRGYEGLDVRVAQENLGPRGRPGLVVSVRGPEGWLNASAPLPPRRPARFAPLALQTALIYLALLAPVLWIGRQVARPLAALTGTAARYRPGEAPAPIPQGGPADVTALARAIHDMQARIQGDIDERDLLLGAIGHDLRTPITSLRLRAEQVADGDLRAKMIRTLSQTERLLEDTLTLARMGRPDGAPEPVDLADLAARTAETARAAGQRVTLGTLDPVTAWGHPVMLARALQNLIENADRYAGGGTVDVRREGDGAVLSVIDEGPGLPDGFEPGRAFARGEGSRSRSTGGAGLGLAIARRAAEAHGGTLETRPGIPAGLVATLTLPWASIEGPRADPVTGVPARDRTDAARHATDDP